MDLIKAEELLDRLDETFDEIKRRLLTALIRKELKAVRWRKPQINHIVFCNGTYLIHGYEQSPWRLQGIRRTVSGAVSDYALTCPKYIRNLILLCEYAAKFCPEDILAEDNM